MKTITSFVYAAFAVLIFAMGGVTANGAAKGSRPHPTPAPRPTPLLTADIDSSYTNSKVPYTIDGQQILEDLGYPFDDPRGVGYGDFNRDGIPDVVFGSNGSSPEGRTIVIALGQPGGGYIEGTTQIISGEVPTPIGASKILVTDFNGDGWPDIFVADAADDSPFNHNWLFLSDGTGHLVYQSALATVDPVGYHYTATAGAIDHSGHIDIFVEGPFYSLINDGQGHFTVDTTRAPSRIGGATTYELIDVDYDGSLDLVIGNWEGALLGGLTEIFWGDGTGFYSDANLTVLPGDDEFWNVDDIDSEDINHDGLRDLVITRSGTSGGFYFQVWMQTSHRVFADESLPRIIHDRSTWIGNNADPIYWIRLVDMTGDGAPDLVYDGAGTGGSFRNLGWANDGNGYFTFTGGWLKVIWTTPLAGGTFSPPAPGTYTYDVNFGKPVFSKSVEPTDLTLSGIPGATVTGVTVIHDNFTAEFTLNIPTGGLLTASIAAGAITGRIGEPSAAFSESYAVSPWAPRPSPTPRPHPTPRPRT